MSILIISTSLNSESRSRRLAAHAIQLLGTTPCQLLDIADLNLPMCDGAVAYSHPAVSLLKQQIAAASAILIAFPIYNYTTAASTKNLIELAGSSFNSKIIGFMCAAGGQRSYMSPMSLANQMMLDFRCLIVPRFVYATDSAFDDTTIVDDSIIERLRELIADTTHLAAALSGAD